MSVLPCGQHYRSERSMIRTVKYKARLRHNAPPYHILNVDVAGKRRIQVVVSPTGRSTSIYVDGKKIEELDKRSLTK